MELRETVELMNSSDYRERFLTEYFQAKIRYDKLYETVVKYEAGTLKFEPKCSLKLLKHQLEVLSEYLYTLEVRAQVEGITLDIREVPKDPDAIFIRVGSVRS